ncbi:MAG TPA: hypothetical protein VFG52_08275 [Xanthomonadales bacterium]|nr:hypothetical protein [Xanthomonadales bacterium]
MNSIKKISRPVLVLPGLLLGLAMVNTASAATTTAQAFEQCREVVEVAFGSADELADVRLEGTRKSGRQLRLRVFTPAGEQVSVQCNVNRKTGELVSIDPPGAETGKKELASSN